MSREPVWRPALAREVAPLEGGHALRAGAAGVVAGLGVFFVVRHLAGAGAEPAAAGLHDVPFVLLSAAVLYAGCWLLRWEVPHRQVARVALWSLAGFLALVAIGVWLGGGRAVATQGAASIALDVGTVGASSGLLVGLEGERRRRRLEGDAGLAVERAEERVAFINRMLRHHLLNGAAVVRGHAELLADEPEDPGNAIEVIRRRSDEMVHLVRNVETLSRAYTGEMPVHAVDPAPKLRAAVSSTGERADGVDVEIERCDQCLVTANDRLRAAFETAIDGCLAIVDDGRLAVDATARDGEFAVAITFDGSVVESPSAAADAGEHGDGALGLFVAETLVEYFGGTLELAVEGPRSALTVRLPLVEAD